MNPNSWPAGDKVSFYQRRLVRNTPIHGVAPFQVPLIVGRGFKYYGVQQFVFRLTFARRGAGLIDLEWINPGETLLLWLPFDMGEAPELEGLLSKYTRLVADIRWPTEIWLSAERGGSFSLDSRESVMFGIPRDATEGVTP